MTPANFGRVIKQAVVAWSDDGVPTLGAALAYYTVFSLAPLLLLAISMGSLVVGPDAARSGLVTEIRETLGPVTADALTAMLDNASRTGATTGMTILGLVILLVGASGAFVELQDALNHIWKVEARPRQGNFIVVFLRHRLLSFTAVVGTGFLLLASLIASAVLAALGNWVKSQALQGTTTLWHGLSMLLSFAIVTLLFALIFKLLPDARVAWRDVWIGAVLTALLFTLGQHLLGLYLGQSTLGSSYGAAGSVVVVLVWVYYSAQIVLFGAEFTHAFANHCGSRRAPRGVLAEEKNGRFGSPLPSAVR